MFKKILSLPVIVCFFLTTLGPLPKAHAADTVLGLPAPGTMINLSPAYEPVIIKGLTIHKDNPFLFDFIVDVGQDRMSGEPLKKEGEKLIKYFLASLAIPDKDLWVNLSPYEKNRMIPEALGQTDMGRDLLEQDYILKQITASLIYPEKQLGKTFWDKVYAKAQELYGTTQIPVNTFNKVWILADRAEVFEHNQTAFVVGCHLKVMLEEDYLALQKHSSTVIPAKAGIQNRINSDSGSPIKAFGDDTKKTNSIGSQIVREIVLPELEKEVNTGKNFANLRQIFNSVILSSWYKKNLKEALLNQAYANKSKVKGINLNDPTVKEQIYQQYLKAYKKGVFNYIKDDVNTAGETIPRKYFSGGLSIVNTPAADPAITTDPAMLDSLRGEELVDFATLASTQQTTAPTKSIDAAMTDQFNELARIFGWKDIEVADVVSSHINVERLVKKLERAFKMNRRDIATALVNLGVIYGAGMGSTLASYKANNIIFNKETLRGIINAFPSGADFNDQNLQEAIFTSLDLDGLIEEFSYKLGIKEKWGGDVNIAALMNSPAAGREQEISEALGPYRRRMIDALIESNAFPSLNPELKTKQFKARLADTAMAASMTAPTFRWDPRYGGEDVRGLYPGVYSRLAVEALGLIAPPISEEIHAMMEERDFLRNERQRIGRQVMENRKKGVYVTEGKFDTARFLVDKRRAQLHFLPEKDATGQDTFIPRTHIRVRDANRANFIGSEIPEKIKIQYVQLTGPAVKPKEAGDIKPEWDKTFNEKELFRVAGKMADKILRGEELAGPQSFTEWLAIGLIGDLRNIAHQLLSGADAIMEDLEDASGQLGFMSLDSQRALKLSRQRSPLFMKVVRIVMAEGKRAGKLRIDGELMSKGELSNKQWNSWKKQIDFTLQIVRLRGLHLDDRQVRDANGNSLAASVVDADLYWTNNWQSYADRGEPMVNYLPKIQRAKEAALWDEVLEDNELFQIAHDTTGRAHIGMLKTYVLDEQHQISFELAAVRAALSQGGTHVQRVNLMHQKREFATEEEYQSRLAEAQIWDEEYKQIVKDKLIRFGMAPAEVERRIDSIIARKESRFLGFNTGRWDKINSIADEYAWDEDWIPPNIENITMTWGFMAPYENLTKRVVNVPDLLGRKALWQGGMEPNIPVGAPEAIAETLKKAIAGAERERDAGAEGKWAAHPDIVHNIRAVWAEKGHPYVEAIQANIPRPEYTRAVEDSLRWIDPDPKKSPITMRGLRNLISVGIQMGNAHLRGLQAAALKPADFFEAPAVEQVDANYKKGVYKSDEEYQSALADAQVRHVLEQRAQFASEEDFQAAVAQALSKAKIARMTLYLMEDMATGEIRKTIPWHWVHKGAKFTEDDEESDVRAGDVIKPDLFTKTVAEEYQKLLNASPKNVHAASKIQTLPVARYIYKQLVLNPELIPWYIDLLNIALDQPPEQAIESVKRFIRVWKETGRRTIANPVFRTKLKAAEVAAPDAAMAIALELSPKARRQIIGNGISMETLRAMLERAKKYHDRDGIAFLESAIKRRAKIDRRAEIMSANSINRGQDHAQTAIPPGGIDLNTSNGMQWKVSKDGNGVEMNVDPAMIERVRREGINWLSPVIFKMTPVTSVWPLVGLKPVNRTLTAMAATSTS